MNNSLTKSHKNHNRSEQESHKKKSQQLHGHEKRRRKKICPLSSILLLRHSNRSLPDLRRHFPFLNLHHVFLLISRETSTPLLPEPIMGSYSRPKLVRNMSLVDLMGVVNVDHVDGNGGWEAGVQVMVVVLQGDFGRPDAQDSFRNHRNRQQQDSEKQQWWQYQDFVPFRRKNSWYFFPAFFDEVEKRRRQVVQQPQHCSWYWTTVPVVWLYYIWITRWFVFGFPLSVNWLRLY